MKLSRVGFDVGTKVFASFVVLYMQFVTGLCASTWNIDLSDRFTRVDQESIAFALTGLEDSKILVSCSIRGRENFELQLFPELLDVQYWYKKRWISIEVVDSPGKHILPQVVLLSKYQMDLPRILYFHRSIFDRLDGLPEGAAIRTPEGKSYICRVGFKHFSLNGNTLLDLGYTYTNPVNIVRHPNSSTPRVFDVTQNFSVPE